jgi:hypothetical protein
MFHFVKKKRRKKEEVFISYFLVGKIGSRSMFGPVWYIEFVLEQAVGGNICT